MSGTVTQSARRRNVGRSTQGERRRNVVIGLLIVVMVGLAMYILSAWRNINRIDDDYGKRKGSSAAMSVNGTAVLAELFRQRGSRVSSWERLSPRLMRADTIVWAPDDFEPPTAQQRDWFKQWQQDGYERTLIYIGRDFDAETEYWRRMLKEAPPDQTRESLRRMATAIADDDSAKTPLSEQADGGWFKVERNHSQRVVRRLKGPWSKGIDPTKAEIKLASIYRLPNNSSADLEVKTLLAAPREGPSTEVDPLVMQLKFNDTSYSQMIVVTNGSFLLNLPLVNHEHRKLAGKLLDACGYPDEVVFLESDRYGPAIVDNDHDARPPGAMQMMSIWPLSAIITHVVALGILLCLALFPIFGRPRSLEPETRSDFAKHVEAVGALLEKTEDYAYANQQVQYYQSRVKRDSGVSHSIPTDALSIQPSESP